MLNDLEFITLRSSIKYFELLAAIVGTIYFKKYNKGVIKYFLLILWYTAINEFFSFFIKQTGVVYTIIYYNIFHLINFSFLFVLYINYLKTSMHRKIIATLFLIYVFSFLINMFFENYTLQIQTVPFYIATVSIIVSIMFYFSQILNSTQVLYVRKNLLIYISVGYLLYLVGNLPIRIIRNYFYEIPNLEYILNLSSILSIIMNICFILGFIWSEKKQL